MSRPAYLRPAAVALVLVGGGIGAGSREWLSRWVPEADGLQLVVPVVNLLGAFLLGWLYERLSRPGEDADRVARLKLLVGTGFCGGLTTYSSLATDTAVLLHDGRAAVAAAYALGTVVLGAGATVLGIVVGRDRGAR